MSRLNKNKHRFTGKSSVTRTLVCLIYFNKLD